ncbi:MAG: HAD hydrolase-like protein [Candidatus Bathyarchaeota archaeon]|jgi:phosphoglycolate phosphatase-like HAD superfamily hydrolase
MPYKCLSKERKIYFREESAKAIDNVAKIVLDFDGVLVYTLQSYYANIRKVVEYYFLEILKLEEGRGNRRLVTFKDIQGFKDTGLYNNDWTLTHTIITYYLNILVRKLQQRQVLDDFIKQFSGIQFSEISSFIKKLREIGNYCKRQGVDVTELTNIKNDSGFGMESLLKRVGEGRQPFEKLLTRVLPREKSTQLNFIKKLVPYSMDKPDLLRRLFEESYLGKELFKKFYGIPPVFNFDECFLEKEEIIPTKETLNSFYSKFGELAVYSEKPRNQAMYLLGKNGFREYFDGNGLVFQEDINKSGSVQLGKPNPTGLIEMIEKLSWEASNVAYVGDTIADLLLVKNARLQGLSNILFFGVLCSSQSLNNLLSQFMRQEADAIMTDVNDVPYLYASLRGETSK